MPRAINAGDVEAALRSAVVTRASAPRRTAEQIAQARLVRAWLGWVSQQEAQGAPGPRGRRVLGGCGAPMQGWATMGVQHVHRAALAAIAARLNGALAE
jgi:hypothetical protein